MQNVHNMLPEAVNQWVRLIRVLREYSRDFISLRAVTWWRHQMETFSALLAMCAGNSSVPGEFPTQRPVTQSFDVFFDLHLNKRLSKQSRGWWFETLLRPLWRHRNGDSGIVVDHWPSVNPGASRRHLMRVSPHCWSLCVEINQFQSPIRRFLRTERPVNR